MAAGKPGTALGPLAWRRRPESRDRDRPERRDRLPGSYIDSNSFVNKAAGLVRRAEELGREVFSPGATALLVIDMQDYFLKPGSHAYLPAAGRIIPGIRELSAAFSSRGLPVFYTRHVNTPQDAGSLGRWWNDIIRPDDPLSEITDELDTALGSVVEKTQYDALHGTEIEAALRDRGTERMVITGVATHLCCETTARSAFVRGFQVTMPFDATATYDEEHHLASLLNLSHGFATITTAAAVMAAVTRGDG